MTRAEYIKTFLPICKKLSRQTSGPGVYIYPETALTQALIESSAKNAAGAWEPGASLLARKYKNQFGIKASPSWKGKTILLSTPNDTNKQSSFRVYSTSAESFKDYYSFLKENKRYKEALKAPNYKAQLKAIAAVGYAESSAYSNLVASMGDYVATIIQTIKPSSSSPLFIAGASLLFLTAINKKAS
jgi:flagellum-specific peptidoglycan hydrolase FlgJ